MIEIRFHGRGGQGVKTAADLLAQTVLDIGKHVQSFPEYGPERSGAPVRSFVRIDDKPITLHCSVSEPDIVVVIDETLLTCVDVAEGLKKQGVLLVNTKDKPEVVKQKTNFFTGKVVTIDATQIAMDTIGVAIPNLPMLAALIKVTGLVSIDGLKEQIINKFGKKLAKEKLEGNIKAIDRAYNEVIVE